MSDNSESNSSSKDLQSIEFIEKSKQAKESSSSPRETTLSNESAIHIEKDTSIADQADPNTIEVGSFVDQIEDTQIANQHESDDQDSAEQQKVLPADSHLQDSEIVEQQVEQIEEQIESVQETIIEAEQEHVDIKPNLQETKPLVEAQPEEGTVENKNEENSQDLVKPEVEVLNQNEKINEEENNDNENSAQDHSHQAAENFEQPQLSVQQQTNIEIQPVQNSEQNQSSNLVPPPSTVIVQQQASEQKQNNEKPKGNIGLMSVLPKDEDEEDQIQSREAQFLYMQERQKRQLEFQRQMEELNSKYNINFRKIIDVKQECMAGNFMAGLLAIKMGYKFVDTIDQFGFSMLHHAVLGNERELVLFLLNNGANVNLLDAQQRTALMMAAHGGSSLDRNKETKRLNEELQEDSLEYQKMMKLHSFNKIFKILIDKGACYNSKDIYGFSPLLYSVQTQNILIFFYLVYLGANIHDADMNGSSVVHWNAYKGNLFLMEVFRSLNLDLFTADNQGFTPIQRALLGISYDSFEFLAKQLPPEQLPNPDEKLANDPSTYVISSPSIREFLRLTKNAQKRLSVRLLKWWESLFSAENDPNQKSPAIFIFVIIAVSLLYTGFTSIYSEKQHHNAHGQSPSFLQRLQFLINIVFFISTFLYMSFSIRLTSIIVSYKNRDKGHFIIDSAAIDRPNQQRLEQERQIPPYMKSIMSDRVQFDRILQRMNFKHIDKLLENATFQSTQNSSLDRTVNLDASTIGDEEESLGLRSSETRNNYSNLTFIHQIAILFENNYFTSLGEVNFKEICGICLKHRPEKTKHCEKCNCCVAYYSFHSTLFNTCICAENYFFYLIHILSLWVSLLTFLTIQHMQFSQHLTSWLIFKYFEIPCIMASRIGLFHGLVYFVALIGFIYVSIDVCLEVLAIFEDKTRDEILNPFDYPYNFEVIQDKKGILQKVPKVRTIGMVEYLKITFLTFYYRSFGNLKTK